MANKSKIARLLQVSVITVTDPESHLPVEVAIYKDLTSGGMIGVDASHIEQEERVFSPFNGKEVEFIEDDNREDMPYEIKIYASKSDFEDRKHMEILDFDKKSEALKVVKMMKENLYWNGQTINVIKIQSQDREDIEIIEL